jgi:thiopurine S-methyltransferase
MEPSFWHARWQEGQIGFHRPSVHPDLLAHGPAVWGEAPCRILVPLCGKSHDLPHLAALGHTVVGAELSPLAVEALHAEHGLPGRPAPRGALRVWDNPGLCVLEGDFFATTPADAGGRCDAAWDRAALVALAPPQRAAYAAHLRRWLRPGASILLNTFQYDQSRHDGPPWSVEDSVVHTLFADCTRTLLARRNLLEAEPRWAERGHTWVHDALWHITVPHA